MDVSELRKRIIRALDDARKDASMRRVTVDEATRAYENFLANVATPVMRQAVIVLKGEGHPFTVQTPAESVRIVADSSPQTFIELGLDRSAARPVVIGRVSLARGRQALVIEERPSPTSQSRTSPKKICRHFSWPKSPSSSSGVSPDGGYTHDPTGDRSSVYCSRPHRLSPRKCLRRLRT